MSENNTKKSVVTIYDVAKEADVSLATVSRVINNSAIVRAERRERVEAAIKKLNFKPNEIARGLARKTTTSIGIIVPDVHRIEVSELLAGIIDTANLKQYGYSVTINSYLGKDAIFKSQVERMISSQIDGLLVMCDVVTDEIKSVVAALKIPVVFFATQLNDTEFSSISINYANAVKIVADYLVIEKQHKEVLILSLEAEGQIDALGEYFSDSIEANNINVEVISTSGNYEKMYTQFLQLFKERGKLPNAIFSTNDTIATAFSNAVQDLNYHVPNDVEIISFSNSQNALICRPQLTSIMYPVYRIGAYAMSVVTKMIKNETVEVPTLADDFEIIWRQSTK